MKRLKQASTYVLMLAIMSNTMILNSVSKKLKVKTRANVAAAKSAIHLKLLKHIKDDYISEVISKTKYPYIIAAIAHVESSYRPQIRGDNGDSWGMYQIQPKHHSWHGDTIEQQTRLCEQILHRLMVQTKSERIAISRYNGKGLAARKYAKRVLEIAKQIERG